MISIFFSKLILKTRGLTPRNTSKIPAQRHAQTQQSFPATENENSRAQSQKPVLALVPLILISISFSRTHRRAHLFLSFAVLAGPRETSLQAGGVVAGRSAPPVLRQVLHAGSGAARGGVHALPVLPADKARPRPGPAAVQRQHCRPHGQLYSSRSVYACALCAFDTPFDMRPEYRVIDFDKKEKREK